jgi:hypothetical protein
MVVSMAVRWLSQWLSKASRDAMLLGMQSGDVSVCSWCAFEPATYWWWWDRVTQPTHLLETVASLVQRGPPTGCCLCKSDATASRWCVVAPMRNTPPDIRCSIVLRNDGYQEVVTSNFVVASVL